MPPPIFWIWESCLWFAHNFSSLLFPSIMFSLLCKLSGTARFVNIFWIFASSGYYILVSARATYWRLYLGNRITNGLSWCRHLSSFRRPWWSSWFEGENIYILAIKYNYQRLQYHMPQYFFRTFRAHTMATNPTAVATEAIFSLIYSIF